MKSNIMTFINKIEGFKTAIKNMHWSARNMTSHKLFDDIADSVSDIQDNISEEAQGMFGRIKANELKPVSYSINGEQQFLNDILETSKTFYNTIKEGDEYIGMRSDMENFIAQINKFQYLMDLSLKESLKHRMQKVISENKYTYYLTESDLNNIVRKTLISLFKK